MAACLISWAKFSGHTGLVYNKGTVAPVSDCLWSLEGMCSQIFCRSTKYKMKSFSRGFQKNLVETGKVVWWLRALPPSLKI